MPKGKSQRGRPSTRRGAKSSSRSSKGRSRSARSRSSSSSSSSSNRSRSKGRSSVSSGRRSSRGSTRGRGSRTGTSRRAHSQSKSQSGVTTDIEFIRSWVEDRGGHPATVKGTERDSEHAGLLRIDFPGYSGEGTLEPIDWDEFAQKFEESNLAFLYQEKTADGKQSRFNKFVARENVEPEEEEKSETHRSPSSDRRHLRAV